MLAPRHPMIINEPTFSRHARWMHSIAIKSARRSLLRSFDDNVAADILVPAHKRRAIDVTAMPRSELTRELAIEEMRRDINVGFAGRASKALLVTLLVTIGSTTAAYSAISSRSDAVKSAFIDARGLKPVVIIPKIPATWEEKLKDKGSRALDAIKKMREKVKEHVPAQSSNFGLIGFLPSAQGQSPTTPVKPTPPVQPSRPSGATKAAGSSPGKPTEPGVAIDVTDVDKARNQIAALATAAARAQAEVFKKAFGIKDKDQQNK